MKRVLILLIMIGIVNAPNVLSKTKSKNDIFAKAIKQQIFYVHPSSLHLSKMHNATTLVISCVDFRLRDETERLLTKHLHLIDDYDEVALPGASLALVYQGKEYWSNTITDIIDILQKLHGIKRVIFIDHRNCGAYKLAKGEAHQADACAEAKLHKQVMLEAKEKINKILPNLNLTIYGLLMGLDGKVENMNI